MTSQQDLERLCRLMQRLARLRPAPGRNWRSCPEVQNALRAEGLDPETPWVAAAVTAALSRGDVTGNPRHRR